MLPCAKPTGTMGGGENLSIAGAHHVFDVFFVGKISKCDRFFMFEKNQSLSCVYLRFFLDYVVDISHKFCVYSSILILRLFFFLEPFFSVVFSNTYP